VRCHSSYLRFQLGSLCTFDLQLQQESGAWSPFTFTSAAVSALVQFRGNAFADDLAAITLGDEPPLSSIVRPRSLSFGRTIRGRASVTPRLKILSTRIQPSFSRCSSRVQPLRRPECSAEVLQLKNVEWIGPNARCERFMITTQVQDHLDLRAATWMSSLRVLDGAPL
jgi:hypothetical protein